MISSIGSTAMMPPTGRMQAPPDPAEKFQELDTDGSGSLELAELETMAEEISSLTGRQIEAEDLLAKFDSDGNGSVAKAEMPEPPQGGRGGPPPFLAADGSVQDHEFGSSDFNPLDSLLSYLDQSEEDEESTGTIDLQG